MIITLQVIKSMRSFNGKPWWNDATWKTQAYMREWY